MPSPCFATDLSPSDAAAWASFAATLLGVVATVATIVAGYKFVKIQIEAAAKLRRDDAQLAELRALALCRQAAEDIVNSIVSMIVVGSVHTNASDALQPAKVGFLAIC